LFLAQTPATLVHYFGTVDESCKLAASYTPRTGQGDAVRNQLADKLQHPRGSQSVLRAVGEMRNAILDMNSRCAVRFARRSPDAGTRKSQHSRTQRTWSLGARSGNASPCIADRRANGFGWRLE
jgi:hypothetical protein